MKVRCPACQKSAHLSEAEAGEMAVCTACGTRYVVPDVPAEPAAIATQSDDRPGERPAATDGRRRAGFWLGLAMAACAVLALAAWQVLYWRNHLAHHNLLARSTQVKTLTQVKTENAPSKSRELIEPKPGPQSAKPRSTAQAARDTMRAVPPPAPAWHAEIAPLVSSSKQTPRTLDFAAPAAASPHPARQPPERPAVIPRPPVHAVRQPTDDLTDEQIGQAIRSGADALLSRFNPRTHLLPEAADRDSPGPGLDILCVYALMQCGQDINDPRLSIRGQTMKDLINAMKALPLHRYHFETYARGLRATALALYNRPEDRTVLGQDAAALVRGARAGAYTYELPHDRPNSRDDGERWDNSNSQYGLLGVWSAAENAFEVPDAYWEAVQRHWTLTQHPNGQWNYLGGHPLTHSMTCAGLASLFVTHDYLDLPKYGVVVGRDPFTPALWKGLRWLEDEDNCLELDHGGYDLYGLERVAFASGFKFFGSHDWYRELAQQVIRRQKMGAGWGNEVETAYELLFLARGRHPILMNKLRFDGYWANRPRDVANLARFAGHELERPLNWQVVPLSKNWTDWMDSPILYLASHKAPRLSETDIRKIRSFVQNGGLLFTQADGDFVEFNIFARELAHRLFPTYEMQELPPDHPLCSVMFRIKPPAGTIRIVTNGSRILMLHSTTDLAKYWQMRDEKYKPYAFDFGANLFLYAAGKRDLRNRLVSTYIPPVADAPGKTFRLARLRYNGNWDPEPAAWERFGRWFHLQTGYGLEVISVPIRDLNPETAPVAELTGTAAYDLSDAEVSAIRNYVESGGVLLADLCGGSGAFDKSLQSALFRAFPQARSHEMPSDHLLLCASDDGMEDLSRPRLRPFALDLLGNHAGLPEDIQAGRGHVIFTPLDITTGLLGTNAWGIIGYQPSYAMGLVSNTILWTLDGQKERPTVARSQP